MVARRNNRKFRYKLQGTFSFVFLSCGAALFSGNVSDKPISVETEKAVIETVEGPREAERGSLRVPLFYDAPDRGSLELPFLRFRSEASGSAPPIFLLAGGPGNTYLDDLENDAGFIEWLDAFLQRNDVVLLEQRGSATTPAPLTCRLQKKLDPASPLDAATYTGLLSEAFRRCYENFRAAGGAPGAYNLQEMALDYHHLRKALNYPRFSLMGGSFGSQLGLTILEIQPDSVHRAVFYGVEGAEHTFDRASAAAGHVERVAAAMNADPVTRFLTGGFRKQLARQLERLGDDPAEGWVEDNSGKRMVRVGAYDMKLLLWSKDGLKGYRDGIVDTARLLIALRFGYEKPLLEAKHQLLRRLAAPGGLELNLMPFLVDCQTAGKLPGKTGGGQTPVPARSSALFGPEIVDAELRAICHALDLDPKPTAGSRPDNREPPEVLLVSGGLDGFTPPDYAREVKARLPEAHLMHAPNGDHDGWATLESDPRLFEQTTGFLAGETSPETFPEELELPPPRLLPIRAEAGLLLVTAALGLPTVLLIVRHFISRKKTRSP